MFDYKSSTEKERFHREMVNILLSDDPILYYFDLVFVDIEHALEPWEIEALRMVAVTVEELREGTKIEL